MRNSSFSGFYRMLEVMMAAFGAHVIPSIGFDFIYYFSAIHGLIILDYLFHFIFLREISESDGG